AMSRRRPAQPPWPAATALAGALAAAAAWLGLTLLVQNDLDESTPLDVPGALLTTTAFLTIAFRRTAPVAAAAVAVTVALVMGVAADYSMIAPIPIALGLVGLAATTLDRPRTILLGTYAGAVMGAVGFSAADQQPLLASIGGFAVGVVPMLIGAVLHAERARTRAAEELARRVEELRDRDVERAVAEERLRIARDVHDITGHHLSAIALQAAGASRMTADPQARASLERIHGLTRDALGQTGHALGMLRQGAGPASSAPPPRLAHVDGLLEHARASGAAVELRAEGRPRALPDAVETCAYRVIQESLTNVVRHAGARHVRVLLDFGADTLGVAVEDDGTGGASPARPGSGITGMRERVALAAGELTAGPRRGGGWAVRATLPLEGVR
ncbi:MAG TPA: sensor histidine kinase, partial [Solirubrobacteraceae bacterium]|nr:sensor histidine kinase [Solirubrobacteraceae bacterium]